MALRNSYEQLLFVLWVNVSGSNGIAHISVFYSVAFCKAHMCGILYSVCNFKGSIWICRAVRVEPVRMCARHGASAIIDGSISVTQGTAGGTMGAAAFSGASRRTCSIGT